MLCYRGLTNVINSFAFSQCCVCITYMLVCERSRSLKNVCILVVEQKKRKRKKVHIIHSYLVSIYIECFIQTAIVLRSTTTTTCFFMFQWKLMQTWVSIKIGWKLKIRRWSWNILRALLAESNSPLLLKYFKGKLIYGLFNVMKTTHAQNIENWQKEMIWITTTAKIIDMHVKGLWTQSRSCA